MIVADLHIHSRYSRATARNLDPENLWLAAQMKGVDLLGTGDFTHPAWLAELEEKLVETGDGAYALRPELARELEDKVPPACRRPVRFLLSGEISSIYKRGGKTRKVHSLILMPGFAAVKRLNARLAKLGNIESDGRPILGLDARDLLELCLEVEPEVIFIPAHIWTPWFSLFGSKSGFDTIEECFGELTGHIQALETGLSSDPPMNWRLSALDRFTLVSHSDAHSPAKLAREADLLRCEPTYPALAAALADRRGESFAGTLEFFPHEGKYHLDGHRKCGVRLEPAETRALDGKCPVCGKPLTVGVLYRVEELADRPPGRRPEGARPFESLVPLAEVLGEVLQRGPATKGVQKALARLHERLGPELFVLRQAPLEELEHLGGPVLAEAVRRVREGRVRVEGGYDGEFGVVGIFDPSERAELKGQEAFWDLSPRRGRRKKTPAPAPAAEAPSQPKLELTPPGGDAGGLDEEQAAAADYRGGHLLVRAGPGSGKTRLLVGRAAALVEEGVSPQGILVVTFTNKAAGELAARLAAASPRAAAVNACTFHALGRRILADALGNEPRLLDPEQRQELLRALAGRHGVSAGELELAVTRAKQSLDRLPPAELLPAWEDYQQELAAQGVLDLDDLVREAVRRLDADPRLLAAWRGRYGHLLVDEYQDVNQVQVELLKRLVGEGSQLCAIGDPDQAIYGFRGADRGFFLRFGQDFPGAARFGLATNYRSQPAVLELAGALMDAEPDPHRQAMRAVRPAGPRPLFYQAASPQEEARWVARKVVELLGGLDSRQVEGGLGGEGEGAGLAACDIAVLYRLHAQAAVLAQALEEAGVPVQVAAREPLCETDPLDFKAQRVSLLSLHAAKGLEWPAVFVTGLEEGILPYQPPGQEPAEEAEERRLLFVALTRARDLLFLSRAQRRSLFGRTLERPSPFLTQLPAGLLERAATAPRRRRARQLSLF